VTTGRRWTESTCTTYQPSSPLPVAEGTRTGLSGQQMQGACILHAQPEDWWTSGSLGTRPGGEMLENSESKLPPRGDTVQRAPLRADRENSQPQRNVFLSSGTPRSSRFRQRSTTAQHHPVQLFVASSLKLHQRRPDSRISLEARSFAPSASSFSLTISRIAAGDPIPFGKRRKCS